MMSSHPKLTNWSLGSFTHLETKTDMKLWDIFAARVNWTNNQDQSGEKKPGYIYSGHWACQADALTQEKVQDILRLLTLQQPVTEGQELHLSAGRSQHCSMCSLISKHSFILTNINPEQMCLFLSRT